MMNTDVMGVLTVEAVIVMFLFVRKMIKEMKHEKDSGSIAEKRFYIWSEKIVRVWISAIENSGV
jgi:hypothetical protein